MPLFARSSVLAGLVVFAIVVSSAPVLADEKLGRVHFPTSCAASVQPAFDRAVALLHSFWLDAAGKAFAGVAQNDPGCAMAHWGTAMVLLGNPLAGARPPKVLKEGMEAVERAKNIGARTARERDYIAAIEAFYRDHERQDHRARSLAYEKAMETVAQRYPQDSEATVFYALALQITAVPTRRTPTSSSRPACWRKSSRSSRTTRASRTT